MRAASAALRGLEGSMNIRAAERFLSTFQGMPGILQAAFPVFGAVAGVAGCLGAVEVIKLVAGLGDPLAGRLLVCDLRAMTFRTIKIARRSDCPICALATP